REWLHHDWRWARPFRVRADCGRLGRSGPKKHPREDTMSEKPLVRFDVEDGIGVITIDYPPVNALGPGVSDGIMEAVDKGEADPNVKAMVMIGAGRSFIAGADIRQFGKSRPTPKR